MGKRVFIFGIMVMLIIMIGCTNDNKSYELKPGKYIEETNGISWIILKDNNEFVFNRHIATSYYPMGKYTIEDNELILTVDDNSSEVYKLKIGDDKLTLENTTKSLEGLVKEGTVFKYTDAK